MTELEQLQRKNERNINLQGVDLQKKHLQVSTIIVNYLYIFIV